MSRRFRLIDCGRVQLTVSGWWIFVNRNTSRRNLKRTVTDNAPHASPLPKERVSLAAALVAKILLSCFPLRRSNATESRFNTKTSASIPSPRGEGQGEGHCRSLTHCPREKYKILQQSHDVPSRKP